MYLGRAMLHLRRVKNKKPNYSYYFLWKGCLLKWLFCMSANSIVDANEFGHFEVCFHMSVIRWLFHPSCIIYEFMYTWNLLSHYTSQSLINYRKNVFPDDKLSFSFLIVQMIAMFVTEKMHATPRQLNFQSIKTMLGVFLLRKQNKKTV